jgi:hypothetical protein
VEAYAQMRGISMELAEKWLAPNLNYWYEDYRYTS